MAFSNIFFSNLQIGRCSYGVQARLLRFRQSGRIRRGGEIQFIDLLFVDGNCSGVHRSLGVHISKVFSVKLDEWTDEQVDMLVGYGGNNAVNQRFEACNMDQLKKPKPDSNNEERNDFIRKKYELHQFMDPQDGALCTYQQPSILNNTPPSLCSAKKRIGNAFRNSWGRRESDHKGPKKSNSLAGMVDGVHLSTRKWQKPMANVLKCNIAAFWSASNNL